MHISVLIPVYGVEKYIERCLRSLFTQTKTDGVEFILVNDCTKDKSIEIAERVIAEYPTLDIKIIHHSTNQGLAAARLTGLKAATGDYIQHIDSDDWCEPTMLEELYSKAVETGADIVRCDCYWDEIVYKKIQLPDDKHDILLALLQDKTWPHIWLAFIKRNLYLNESLEEFHPKGINNWEDVVSSIKLFYFAEKIVYLPRAFVHYMQLRADSYSRNRVTVQYYIDICNAVNNIDSFLIEQNSSQELLNAFISWKIRAKLLLITQYEHGKMNSFAKYWPEIDKYVYKSANYTWKTKLFYLLLTNNLHLCYTFIRSLRTKK